MYLRSYKECSLAKHFADSSAPKNLKSHHFKNSAETDKAASLRDSIPDLGNTAITSIASESTTSFLNSDEVASNTINNTNVSSDNLEPAPVKSKFHFWIIPASIIGLAACIYLGGAIFFNFFFMPQTSIYGKDYSLKPASDLQASRANEASNYSVQVSGNGVDLTIKASDVDLTYDAAGYARDAISQQNPWMWPLELTHSRTLSPHATASYDTSKVDSLFNQRIEQAKESAHTLENNGITYDSSAKKFIFADDAIATRLSLEGVHKDLQDAFNNLNTTVQLGQESLMSAEDLDKALKTANSYIASSVDLMLGDSSAYQLDQDIIASWIKFDENLSISFDTDAITKWVNETLAPAVDTRGTSRTYKRWDGKEFTTKAAGAYGWVIDNDAAVKAISDGLSSGQATKIDIPTKQTAGKFTKLEIGRAHV